LVLSSLWFLHFCILLIFSFLLFNQGDLYSVVCSPVSVGALVLNVVLNSFGIRCHKAQAKMQT